LVGLPPSGFACEIAQEPAQWQRYTCSLIYNGEIIPAYVYFPFTPV
jgi:hypothetical protein